MVASYDYGEVALSALVSIVAAYAARNLLERVRGAHGGAWLIWLVVGAAVDDVGTWSMHYTGMLSLRLPVPVLYDWPTVAVSFLVGFVGSVAALLIVSFSKIGSPRAVTASILWGGVGISGLHYTAMTALRFQGMHHHAPAAVFLSVALAIGLTLMSLLVMYPFRGTVPRSPWREHSSTLLRGAANPVMHYTAMAGVTFMRSNQAPDLSHVVSIASLGILGISVVPAMGLVVALLTALVDRLQRQRALLQVLSQRLLQAQEAERRLIARELHDEIGQAFTAVKLNLQALQHSVAAPQKAQLDESISVVEAALQQVRGLSMELRPSVLDDLGLAAALRWLADRQAERAGFKVQVIADLQEERLPAEVETASFRVAQEALTNIVRHAGADDVQVEVRLRGTELELVIHDDGVGFDVPAAQARATRGESLGLLGMQERVALVGGDLKVVSAPGQGSEVRAHFTVTVHSKDAASKSEGTTS